MTKYKYRGNGFIICDDDDADAASLVGDDIIRFARIYIDTPHTHTHTFGEGVASRARARLTRATNLTQTRMLARERAAAL